MPSKMKTCEHYRTAIIDAAAAADQLSIEVRAHVDGCPDCHATFAEEKQLFSAIDSRLYAAANVEVPASLFPRVRAQLNERTASRLSWVPAGALIATVAAVILAIVYIRSAGRGGVEPNPLTISAVNKELPAVLQPSTQVVAPTKTALPAKGHLRGAARNPSLAEAAEDEAVKVMVPIGEKRGMLALLTNLQQGKVAGEVLLAEKAEKTFEELQVSPLAIAPIEVKPLVDVSPEPASALENEETKR
jgi:hypothetical protein